MSDKAIVVGPAVRPGWSTRTLKMNFIELVIFGVFFWFSTSGWSAPENHTVHALSRIVLFSPLDSP
jgi:hypothetical protein